MKVAHAFLVIFLCTSNASFAENTNPRDVQVFIKDADRCVHLAGEWGGDLEKKEKIELQRSIGKICGRAKKQLDKLEIKYKNNIRVNEVLSHYADSVKLYQKNN